MTTEISGKTKLRLLEPDQSGNTGYWLTFNYLCNKHDVQNTLEYKNIDFSGPGTWDEYSTGEDYPFDKMAVAALVDMLPTEDAEQVIEFKTQDVKKAFEPYGPDIFRSLFVEAMLDLIKQE